MANDVDHSDANFVVHEVAHIFHNCKRCKAGLRETRWKEWLLDIEYRKLAFESGITNFRRVPALDTNPAFIQGLARLVQHALEGPEVNLDQAAALPSTVKLYPQDKWSWGWNNSSEVWNGRLAMLGLSAFLVELIRGSGPLHALGLL